MHKNVGGFLSKWGTWKRYIPKRDERKTCQSGVHVRDSTQPAAGPKKQKSNAGRETLPALICTLQLVVPGARYKYTNAHTL